MELPKTSTELHMPIFYGEISMEFFCREVKVEFFLYIQMDVLQKIKYYRLISLVVGFTL
jgi:hypothetical protein